MTVNRIKSLQDLTRGAERAPLHRTLGAFELTFLGIGAIIGTGIFLLTALGAERAGPGLLLSFFIAGLVCVFAALAYAELTAMAPVAGSAYSFAYLSVGEWLAWLVGWNLILEYTAAAAAVAAGWAGYINGLLAHYDLALPLWLRTGYFTNTETGGINLLAVLLVGFIAALLVRGTRESARLNAFLVGAKLIGLLIFIAVTVTFFSPDKLSPFMPYGFWATEQDGLVRGVLAAASLIFFAYVGFDAVSTAAEETVNPQRNIPIGVIASIVICTLIYLLVILSALGAVHYKALAGNPEPLAYVMRTLGYEQLGNVIALIAIFALPTVIMVMLYGQTRIFFVMARDGLIPRSLTRLHTRYHTPARLSWLTAALVAILAGLLPLDQIAEMSNTGTLFAFIVVAIAVMLLRHQQPNWHRPFRCPAVYAVAGIALMGCVLLFISLPANSIERFGIWSLIGLVIYGAYGYRHSEMSASTKRA